MKKREKFVVSPDLRQMVLFAPHNLAKDPPFTRLDLITCRNLLIYLNPATQKRILSLFQFGLKTGGFLFLGPEREPRGERRRIRDDQRAMEDLPQAARRQAGGRLGPFHSSSEATDLVNQRLAGVAPATERAGLPRGLRGLARAGSFPSGLLIDEHHQLLHAFGTARQYLRLPEGRATSDVLRMVDDDLRMAISSAVHRAGKERAEIALLGGQGLRSTTRNRGCASRSSRFRWGDSSPRSTSSASSRTSRPRPRPMPAPSFDARGESADRIRQLEQELVYTKEHLQTTIEELEASNEELQSTNEELVASNEELQSTNEELHSVNEELYTVNAEYQKKIDELTQLTNDIDNLLHSTDIGTVFLDINLNIRKFTPAIAQVFNLLPLDVGRPLKHISNNIRIEHGTLIDLIEQMISDGRMIVREVGGPGGETFLMRILPYRTQNGVISGTVLTFVDITAIKQAQYQLEESQQLLKAILDNSQSTIFAKDLQGRYLFINRPFPTHERTPREQLLGKTDAGALRRRTWPGAHVAEDQRVVATGHAIADRGDLPVRRRPARVPQDQVPSASTAARRFSGVGGISTDISPLKRAEIDAREALVRRDTFLAMLSHELRNPLGAILNANYLLLDEATAEPARREAVDVIRRQGELMSRLLDDLLDVSRLTQDKIRFQNDPVDLVAGRSRRRCASPVPRSRTPASRSSTEVCARSAPRPRRRRAASADGREPAHQRGQVHAPRRLVKVDRAPGRRRGRDPRPRTRASASSRRCSSASSTSSCRPTRVSIDPREAWASD